MFLGIVILKIVPVGPFAGILLDVTDKSPLCILIMP
jgi:hypothetical protein